MKKNRRLFIMLLIIALASGCASNAAPTTQPHTAAEQQDKVLADPMGYKPAVRRDISGGDITHFDRGGFDEDMNDALNP